MHPAGGSDSSFDMIPQPFSKRLRFNLLQKNGSLFIYANSFVGGLHISICHVGETCWFLGPKFRWAPSTLNLGGRWRPPYFVAWHLYQPTGDKCRGAGQETIKNGYERLRLLSCLNHSSPSGYCRHRRIRNLPTKLVVQKQVNYWQIKRLIECNVIEFSVPFALCNPPLYTKTSLFVIVIKRNKILTALSLKRDRVLYSIPSKQF